VLTYDIWIGFNDAIMRVIALMGIGIMMMIISSLYSKKYGNQLKGEFFFSNITRDSIPEKKIITKKVTQKTTLNDTIIDINIDGIYAIKFELNGGEKFSTRAKNLIKIIKFVTDNAEKTSFLP